MSAPWKILHLDLTGSLPALPSDPAAGGVYAVFWGHGLPLGHVEITAAQLPMPAAQLAALAAQIVAPAVGDRLLEYGFKAPLLTVRQPPGRLRPPDYSALQALIRPLEQVQAQRQQEDANAERAGSVSVVVCTRNRPEPLRRCLRALQKLSPAPQEMVIVDNAPSDERTRKVVAVHPGVRYVREPQPGLSAARNAGIRAATSQLIAFTDDDVTVPPPWIARLRQAFTAPDVMAVTGLILPAELETEAQLQSQRGQGDTGWGYRVLDFDRETFFEPMKWRGVPVWQLGAGANMAFRREAFAHVGLFDERLGAGTSGCSEDSELWYRLLAEGWRCRYDPATAVFHYHRRDVAELNHQMHQYMRGHVAALLVQFEKYGHVGNLYRALGVLPRHYAQQLLRRLWQPSRSTDSTLGAQMRGCAAGVAYYLRHRHLPGGAAS